MTMRHIGLMALLAACGVLVVGQLYVTIPMSAHIAEQFGVDLPSAALSSSAFGLAYAVGLLVFGSLSDRYGRRIVLIGGLLAVAVTTLLVSSASTYELMLAARTLQGFAAASIPPTIVSVAAETLPEQQRPVGISLISFSFLASAPVAQLFAAQSGAGLPVLMLELAPVYVLLAIGLLVMRLGGGGGVDGVDPGFGAAFSSLLADRSIVAAWTAAATVLFGFITFYAGAEMFAPTMGVDLQTLRMIGLPTLLMTFATVPLSRRVGAATTARIGLFVIAAGLVLGASGSGPLLLLGGAVLAAGVALAVPGLISTVAERAADANRGLAVGFYAFVLFVGASIAPPVAQLLGPLGLGPLFLVPAALLGLAALVLGRARGLVPTLSN